MSNRAAFEREHPSVFYLDPANLAGLRQYLLDMDWMPPSEALISAEKAGEGNMNCTVRVRTDRRTFILKQARPWVEKYPQIPAPWDRAIVEGRFYELIGGRPDLSRQMPALVGLDPHARLLCLQDLGESQDFTFVYQGGSISDQELETLLEFMSNLHRAFRHSTARDIFVNREMRGLNHQHIFVLPLEPGNGLDLDEITPGLQDAARNLQTNAGYKQKVRDAGELYLADGECLLHGDYFPGSWLRSATGLRIIDPEFCFFGPAEFDAGVMLAHMLIAGQTHKLEFSGLDRVLVDRFAGIEIMRRLIGVAQLPVTCGIERKRELLTLSREMV